MKGIRSKNKKNDTKHFDIYFFPESLFIILKILFSSTFSDHSFPFQIKFFFPKSSIFEISLNGNRQSFSKLFSMISPLLFVEISDFSLEGIFSFTTYKNLSVHSFLSQTLKIRKFLNTFNSLSNPYIKFSWLIQKIKHRLFLQFSFLLLSYRIKKKKKKE